MEDGAQLAGRTRDTKYDYSVERLIELLDYCTFPAVQRLELFRRLVFNFLVGNEDMHLKNHALITRDGIVELAPVFDYLNTTCVYRTMGRRADAIEETALPIRGRKRGLSRGLFAHYLGQERLALRAAVIQTVLQSMQSALSAWRTLVDRSFLAPESKALYWEIVEERMDRLELR
jgi:serine/threonine-protein kinase HipA